MVSDILSIGYNASLLYDLDNLPPNPEKTAESASLLKRHCFASVFEKYFEFQEQEETGHKRATIQYRDDETMYVYNVHTCNLKFHLSSHTLYRLIHLLRSFYLDHLPKFTPLYFRYVDAQKDRVTVIFSTVFKDDDDIVIGKVFMQVILLFNCI